MNNKELVKRAFFGALFVVAVILSVCNSKELFFVSFLMVLALGLKEFYKIAKLAGASPLSYLGMFIGSFLYAYVFHEFSLAKLPNFLLLFAICIFLVLLIEIFRKSKTTLLNIATLFGGILYLLLPIFSIAYLFFKEQESSYLVLSIFCIIWANDTFAYLLGSQIGKTKLAPSISPKKTWEGAVGGLLGSLLIAFFLPANFLPYNLKERLLLGLLIVLFSTLGDLFQSKLKRSVGIKDSGNILPGHGGILDRVDSMLFAFPAIFIYLEVLNSLK